MEQMAETKIGKVCAKFWISNESKPQKKHIISRTRFILPETHQILRYHRLSEQEKINSVI
jgi:hypothetical protein